MLCISVNSAHRVHYPTRQTPNNYDYHDGVESQPQVNPSNVPIGPQYNQNNGPRYEVTENVDDVPNNMEYRPVITNYSIPKPLNFAGNNNGGNYPAVNNRPPKNNNNVQVPPGNVNDETNVNEDYYQSHEDIHNFNDILQESLQGLSTGLLDTIRSIGKELAEAPNFIINEFKKADEYERRHFFDHDHGDEEFKNY
jgi:hypothetical protein